MIYELIYGERKKIVKIGREDRRRSLVKGFESRWRGHQGVQLEKEKIFPHKKQTEEAKTQQVCRCVHGLPPWALPDGTFPADDPSSEPMEARTLPGRSP